MFRVFIFMWSFLPSLALVCTQTAPVELRVQALTSQFHYVPGVQIDVTQGSYSASYSTDSQGLSQGTFQVASGVPVSIRVGEAAVVDHNGAMGRTLGQLYDHTPPVSSILGLQLLSLHSPVAQRELVDSSVPALTSRYADLWSIVPPEQPTGQYSFLAHLGFLSSAEEVGRYIGYHGLAVARTDYIAGFVVYSDDANLGSDGLFLTVNFERSSEGAPPFVDPYHIGPAAGKGFQVSQLYWEQQRALYGIRGTFKSGVNLLLFYPAPVGQVQATVSSTYLVGSATPSQPLDSVPRGVNDCIPPPTTPDFSWAGTPNPPAPRSSFLCPPATKKGPLRSFESSTLLGDPTCGSEGESESTTQSKTWKGTAGLSGTINPKGNGVTLSLGAEYSHTETSTRTYTFGKGAFGCGQCFATYVQQRRSFQDWDRERLALHAGLGGFFLGCVDSCVTTIQVDTYNSGAPPCSRECPSSESKEQP